MLLFSELRVLWKSKNKWGLGCSTLNASNYCELLLEDIVLLSARLSFLR